MTVENLFERASREALRFNTTRGLLTTEELWQVPLKAKSGFDLDNITRDVNAELRAETEESFVETKTSPRKAQLELKMALLLHIIGVKKAETAAAELRAAKAAKRQQILGIIADKQAQSLHGKSIEELQAELAALD